MKIPSPFAAVENMVKNMAVSVWHVFPDCSAEFWNNKKDQRKTLHHRED
jgi:hypothetical protein